MTKHNDDVFDVAHEMTTKLRSEMVGATDSINGKLFTKMVQTLMIVRAVNRLTAAVKTNTEAVEKQTRIMGNY